MESCSSFTNSWSPPNPATSAARLWVEPLPGSKRLSSVLRSIAQRVLTVVDSPSCRLISLLISQGRSLMSVSCTRKLPCAVT